jgi:hypothetical protein
MIVYCEMKTWVGSASVWYAKHYYAKLVHGNERKELWYILTAEEAKALTKSEEDDEGARPYVVGDDTSRFLSEDRLKEAALAQYKEAYPGATILVYGEKCVCEPQIILDGPPELMATVNALYEEGEANNWWEDDEEVMEDIYKRFCTIWETVDP